MHALKLSGDHRQVHVGRGRNSALPGALPYLLTFLATLACTPAAVASEVPSPDQTLEIGAPTLWIKGVDTEVRVRLNGALAAAFAECVLQGGSITEASQTARPGEDIVFQGVRFESAGRQVLTVTAGSTSSAISGYASYSR